MSSYLIVIDGEYTGPNPFENALIDVGVVYYNLNEARCEKYFQRYINIPKNCTWNEDTLNNFWKSKVDQKYFEWLYNRVENNMEHFLPNVINDLYKFLKECYQHSNGNIMIASDRVDVDIFWLNTLFCQQKLPTLNKIFDNDFRILDLTSFHQGLSLTTYSEIQNFEKNGSGFNCFESSFKHYGILNRPMTKKSHKAIDDAHHNAQAHCIIYPILVFKNIKMISPIPPSKSMSYHHHQTTSYTPNNNNNHYHQHHSSQTMSDHHYHHHQSSSLNVNNNKKINKNHLNYLFFN